MAILNGIIYFILLIFIAPITYILGESIGLSNYSIYLSFGSFIVFCILAYIQLSMKLAEKKALSNRDYTSIEINEILNCEIVNIETSLIQIEFRDVDTGFINITIKALSDGSIFNFYTKNYNPIKKDFIWKIGDKVDIFLNSENNPKKILVVKINDFYITNIDDDVVFLKYFGTMFSVIPTLLLFAIFINSQEVLPKAFLALFYALICFLYPLGVVLIRKNVTNNMIEHRKILLAKELFERNLNA